MTVTEQDIAVFKAAFYNNDGDETADPVAIALEAVFKARGSFLVSIDTDRKINPADVSSLVWDRRFYMNGSESTLVITMCEGSSFRLKNNAWTNASDIERQISAALPGGA